jgi:hypothetical protein
MDTVSLVQEMSSEYSICLGNEVSQHLLNPDDHVITETGQEASTVME